MKRKLYIIFSILSLLFLVQIPFSRGFEHVDSINEGISVYFLTSMNQNSTLEISVTHLNSGTFALFLFDTRPSKDYVNLDKTLNPEIYSVCINYSLANNPYINYSILETKIYYIQLLLLDNGPDTFFLICNVDLTRYYLPIIPGYDIPLILLLNIGLIGVIIIQFKKKLD
jgi:hypothetical protein